MQQDWSLITASAMAGAWMISHLARWWLPYLFGLSWPAPREGYQQQFSRTLTILPSRGRVAAPVLDCCAAAGIGSAEPLTSPQDEASGCYYDTWFATGLDAMVLGFAQRLSG